MRFYSSNNKKTLISFREAALKGLAMDGGLFMPQRIPRLSRGFFNSLDKVSFVEMAFKIARNFLGKEIPAANLRRITKDAFNFKVPLVPVAKDIYTLELFHGPTLAFKDFGGRFMARLIAYFMQGRKKELTILVATSGDTGSAVASGFYGLPGIRVIILYPRGKVSEIQEKQLTTMGGNVTALEVKGSFDDCQRLVKKAFVNKELNRKLLLASANSINIARLIPQAFYYFSAFGQLMKTDKAVRTGQKPVVFSVPCGNFGNLTAGLIAKKMGLPVAKFIAATNVNDAFVKYLKTGRFTPCTSKETISNAMDIGNPNNFARIKELYGGGLNEIKKDISGYSFTDRQTRQAIKNVYDKYGYVMDPHGAVAYLGLKQYRLDSAGQDAATVFLETAHPAKFKETVEKIVKVRVPLPHRLEKCLDKKKESIISSNKFKDLKDFLLS